LINAEYSNDTHSILLFLRSYKYGELDESGNLILNPTIKQEDESFKVNPNFLEFQNEYSNLLQTLKELEYTPFLLSDIEQLTFEENYPIFNKLITNDKEV
jgi:hypothetical protein